MQDGHYVSGDLLTVVACRHVDRPHVGRTGVCRGWQWRGTDNWLGQYEYVVEFPDLPMEMRYCNPIAVQPG